MIDNQKAESQENPRMIKFDVKYQSYSSMGFGPKKLECQDSDSEVKLNENCHFFAIYDGHGFAGKEAAQATNYYFQTYMERQFWSLKNINDEEEVKQFLLNAFSHVENELENSGMNYSSSGTCVVGILILNDKCYSINLGDSRAIMYKESVNKKTSVELTHDHRPTRV